MLELTHLLGIVLALGAALSNAIHNLCIRAGTDEGTVFDAVFVVMVVNVVVLVPLVLVGYYPDYGLTRQSWLSFIAAGVAGTMAGRLCMYSSIDRIGASRTAPIVAAWALLSTILGVIVLGETVSLIHGFGVVCIVGGVVVIAWETTQENPENLSRRALLLGFLLPLGAALAYGWEPIFASIGLAEGTPAPVGLVIKTVSAIGGFLLYLRWKNALPTQRLLHSTNSRWFILAGICNTLFLLGYYVALEFAPVSIVTPIIITNTLFVVVLAAIVMPERLERVTPTVIGAAAVVVVGVAVITVYG